MNWKLADIPLLFRGCRKTREGALVGAVTEAMKECEAGNSSPDTGGVDATSIRSREASFNGADGVVEKCDVF